MWYITPLTKGEFAGITPGGDLAILASIFGGLISGIPGGLVIGVGQSLVVRAWSHRTMNVAAWIVLTTVGLGIAWAVGDTVALFATLEIDFPPTEAFGQIIYGNKPMLNDLVVRAAVVGLSVGLILGAFQGLAFLPHFKRSLAWWAISTIAVCAATVVFELVYVLAGGPLWDPAHAPPSEPIPSWAIYDSEQTRATIIGWIVGGITLGAITAAAMKSMASRVNPERPIVPD